MIKIQMGAWDIIHHMAEEDEDDVIDFILAIDESRPFDFTKKLISKLLDVIDG